MSSGIVAYAVHQSYFADPDIVGPSVQTVLLLVTSTDC